MDINSIFKVIIDQKELFIRLLFACFCGAIIGIERSYKRKGAGIKTHIILALGSALFMIVSQYGFLDLALTPEFRADASRIASNIVTGVSFLCAGVIFVRGASVKGLTTATGIWTTAGIGMAAGAGMYAITFFATVLIVIIQLVLAKPSAIIETHYSVEITAKMPSDKSIDEFVSSLSKITNAAPTSVKLDKSGEENTVHIVFNIQHSLNANVLIQTLRENDQVLNVSWAAL